MSQTSLSGLGAHEITLGGWIRNHYELKIQRLIPKTIWMTRLFRDRTQAFTMAGEKWQFPIEAELPSATGWRDADGYLPTSNDSELKWGYADTRNIFASAQFQKKTLKRISNSSAAEALFTGINHKMKLMLESMQQDYNLRLFQDGTGILCRVAADAVNTTTIVGRFWDNSAARGATYFAARRQLITIRSGVAPYALKAVTEIMRTNFDTAVLTLRHPVTVSAGDIICRGDDNGDDFNYALNGLYSVFNATTSYMGVSFAEIPEWEPIVDDNGGVQRNYSYEDVINALVKVENENEDVEIDQLVCSPALWLEHFKLYGAQVQYATFDYEMEIGIDLPVFMYKGKRLPMLTTKYIKAGDLVGLNTSSWGILRDAPFEFDKEANGGLLKWVQGRDAVALYGRAYEDLVCMKPRSNVLLTNFRTTQTALRA